MAENVEEIEAKLAAYVDGELTPAEKVEIETHLEANPSHRALLKDLVQHRQLLRALPREKAPGDCTEGFQGQLERDILLGGDELTRSRSRFRIRYSPQLLSAAAIIILAIGLAVVVFSVLPPHHPRAPLAQLTNEPAKPSDAPGMDAMADSRSYGVDALHVEAKKGAADRGETLAMKDVANKLEAEQIVGLKAKADSGDGLALVGTPEMLVITVTADDLKGANEAVVRYLASNNINYTAPAVTMLRDEVQLLDGAVQNGTLTALGQAQLKVPAEQLPAITAGTEVAKREEDLLARQRAARPAPTRSPTQERVDAALQEVAQEQAPAPTAGAREPQSFAKAASPTTQPVGAVVSGRSDRRVAENAKTASTSSTSGESIAGVAGGAAGAEGTQQLKQLAESETREMQIRGQLQHAFDTLDTKADYAGARVILAHNMNGRQVQELAVSLRQPERNQWAFVRSNASSQNRRLSTAWDEDAERQTDYFLAYRKAAEQLESVARDKYFGGNSGVVSGPATQPAIQADNIAAANAGLSREEANLKPGATVDLPAQNRTTTAAFYELLKQERFVDSTTRPAGNDVFACYIVVQPPAMARGTSAPATQPVTNTGRPTTAPAAGQQIQDTAR